MKCPDCSRRLTVHLLEPDGGVWSEQLYCESCRRSHAAPGAPVCEHCRTSYRRFLRAGLLGCARCYGAFAPQLAAQLQKYHGANSTSAARPARSRLALARSAEIRSALADLLEAEAVATPRPTPARRPREARPQFSRDAVLLSLRVRLARNLRGAPYWNRLPPGARERLAEMLLGERAALSLELFGGRLRRLSAEELHRRAEAGLAPRAAQLGAAPAEETDLAPREQALAYCGDEDHIRLQWMALEPPPGEASALAMRGLDLCRRFDELYDWQHSPDFGWLTACPALAGQALRVSFLLNIAALLRSGIWPAWRDRLLAYGLEIRGADGEGSPETDLVQLSNRHWPRDADPAREILRLTALVERIVTQEISLRSKVGPPESDMS